ncbi:hypothetical protein [uncultured Eubacterium sp.]|uniref:hypothetical protein n=1 Tax=uncultured Eubacterium sp. TaxID=165185 RepID=UPI0025DF7A5B|nr:hypothetical protein [uncultured Eubacterium sp.]
MPDKDLPRLDIDSVMPYDCIRLKYAWAEQSEKYHNGNRKCRHRISATLWLKRLRIS